MAKKNREEQVFLEILENLGLAKYEDVIRRFDLFIRNVPTSGREPLQIESYESYQRQIGYAITDFTSGRTNKTAFLKALSELQRKSRGFRYFVPETPENFKACYTYSAGKLYGDETVTSEINDALLWAAFLQDLQVSLNTPPYKVVTAIVVEEKENYSFATSYHVCKVDTPLQKLGQMLGVRPVASSEAYDLDLLHDWTEEQLRQFYTTIVNALADEALSIALNETELDGGNDA